MSTSTHEPCIPQPLSCDEARQKLPLYLDGEYEHADMAQIEAHLASCPACSQAAHFEQRFKRGLRQAVQTADQAALPFGFEARLQRRIQRSQAAHRARYYLVPALAAAGLVAVLTFTSSSALSAVVEESVQQHANDALVDYASPDAGHIERLLAQRMGMAVRVPIMASSRISLRGARLTSLQSRPAAHLVYGTATARISVVAVPDPKNQLDTDDERVPKPSGRLLHLKREKGFNVVVWRQDGTLYSMVSELQPRDMMRLVFREELPARAPVQRRAQPSVPIVPVSF